GEFFTHLLYGAAGVDSFQFYQPDMHRIILSVVPGRDADADRKTAVENALRQLGQLAPGQLEVEYREVDQIPRSSAGKHRFTRSDVSAPVHPVER
ncbi:MAG TPA: hypothetical protein VHG09_07605, partial [Longimicrobiales bacterium]|nr:hypothetical protein [Longimicrobiales bacterium]